MGKRRQQQIPGTEPVLIQEVVEAAEEYRERRDERMELQKKEESSRKALYEAMKKHGQEKYAYEDVDGKQRVVELIITTKVKVKRKQEESDGDDEGGGGGSPPEVDVS